MTKESLKELRNEWEIRVAEFKASGKSQSAWCREEKINLRTFNYWYRKFKNTDDLQQHKSSSWLSVKLEKTFEKTETSIINIKLNNMIIETNPEFDSEHLLRVVRTLNSLC